MVNKDMNGFPVKKCSAFQFFKKRVRRWIKSPVASVDKRQSPRLQYAGPSAVHMPPGQRDLEPSLCQTCLGDHAFQRGGLPQEESCSWETQSECEVKEPCNHANILTTPDPRTFWTNDDSAFMKQRRMGLNDFIQKIANNSYACKHPEVQSILKISQPQEPELMNANPSPPPSPSQQINLGPSSNPHAKPSDFHFLKVIGKGSFGKVLLARHKAEEVFYAVKVLQKKAILKKKEEKHIMSERNVLLKNVKHPFLVGLHFSFQTADKLYFVLDYINGGELFYHLQRERCFLEPRARFYAAEIASALGYLHSLNIVYRDLKPENILLDSQGHIVLTDFGLCKENIEHNGTTSTFCGTPEYLAPEVLHKQPYDRTVDWWCLGAVLYEMLYGLPPFYSRNTAEMYDNILNKPLQLKPNITNSARHLLEGLLQKDRTKRLGAKEDFMEIKNHVFFSLINWDDLINKKITPPFNPNVSGPSDLRHFDPEFTEEPVPSSIGRSPDSILLTASVKEAAEAFLGFSYAPPMDSFL
ncbi:PREDICTED: serine/threonine-protein kinase Sgk1 isoform X4 [Ceratotherium simum simum]|uniref:Serine/threonine-protein kinase Sgk1 isoform X4 n=1 Tax=Ceratotherium simum simum TaxID=73337 RepID=A0ABM0H9I8_CERSS|nr:PREDICTED: serine/threonine-protein kinase Sgk1 isoform X4 [Ceratotherium simum simum]